MKGYEFLVTESGRQRLRTEYNVDVVTVDETGNQISNFLSVFASRNTEGFDQIVLTVFLMARAVDQIYSLFLAGNGTTRDPITMEDPGRGAIRWASPAAKSHHDDLHSKPYFVEADVEDF